MSPKDEIADPSLFDYLDYRLYLRDKADSLKSQKKFNLRLFAKQAGISAPGYLKMIIEGRRNLTEKTAKKFAHAFKLSGKEYNYFLTLVLYNQSEDPDLKKNLFERLIALKPRSEHFLAQKRHNRYFAHHHHVCIREMVVLKDFHEDYKWIAQRCFPTISPQEAKKAIDTLLELGLLKRNEKGKLAQVENFIHTQDKNTEEIEAYHFHEAVLDKARHALGQLPQNERNYYALTLPLPQSLFEEVINDFYEFRDKIVQKINASQKNFDDVYQINFQFFPVTRKGNQP